ncbi:sterol homeostasis protein [Chamberlinius hualienensis]
MGKSFRCIECGKETSQLYKHYSCTVLKLNVCDDCGNVADSYIEYDNCIVFMDAFLQKIPAIRHIIFNSEFKGFWKLGVFCLLCDAYVKWNESRSVQQRAGEFHLEWAFYYTCLCSILDTCAFTLALTAYCYFTNHLNINYSSLVNAVLFGKFGLLLIIPTVIWDLCQNQIYTWIRILFIIISNIQVYRAVCLTSRKSATAGIILAYIIQSIPSYILGRCWASYIT